MQQNRLAHGKQGETSGQGGAKLVVIDSFTPIWRLWAVVRRAAKGCKVYEIEVQNESTQTQQTLRFVAVPRIGEGVRLLDFDGTWASYDVIDVWYQQSAFGEVWVPYMHVRKSGAASGAYPEAALQQDVDEVAGGPTLATAVAHRR